MRKLLLALGALLLTAASASAACLSPAVMHDFPGTAFNMSLSTAPDGNCGSNVMLPNSTATGAITTTQSVTLAPAPGQSSVGIQVTGTWTGTLFVEGSVDGTNFVQTTTVPVLSGSIQSATITASGMYQANLAGFASFRIRGNTVASGTATVTLIGTAGNATVMADNPFPITGYTGMVALNVIGNTAIGSATTDKPLMIGGSSTGASGGNAQIAKVDSTGTQFFDCSAVGNTLCGLINSATPAGNNTIGNVGADPSQGKGIPTSVPINVSTATTTQLVAASGSTAIYVTSFDVIAGGTGNITFEYGTGASCGTGTTALTGAYNLTAQAGIAKGNGVGTILKVPASNALCVVTTAAVQMSGSVSYQQF